jgi:hypothetical protein
MYCNHLTVFNLTRKGSEPDSLRWDLIKGNVGWQNCLLDEFNHAKVNNERDDIEKVSRLKDKRLPTLNFPRLPVLGCAGLNNQGIGNVITESNFIRHFCSKNLRVFEAKK